MILFVFIKLLLRNAGFFCLGGVNSLIGINGLVFVSVLLFCLFKKRGFSFFFILPRYSLIVLPIQIILTFGIIKMKNY